ncbi:MAG TPA: squalene synthase HpnC [bacterium]|nr:squalene synthase HpnC [bacterium]HQL61375.1 squalene synthase HpnC [bacterium]
MMDGEIEAAYRHCLRIVRGHYENFPVASFLVPRNMRRAVASIYAFARGADDFADEGDIAPDERLKRLDAWQEQLERCGGSSPSRHTWRGGPGGEDKEVLKSPPQPSPSMGREIFEEESCLNPVFLALKHTIREYDLPVQLFRDLITAFRRDVTVQRYETWEGLLNDYCRFSANPVGRLILCLFGYREESLFALSDCICTALQLTNFWQDISVDLEKGRIYAPQELMKKHGYTEDEFVRKIDSPNFRSLHRELVDRTRRMFLEGARLPALVRGCLSWEIRAVWLGGMRILEKVEKRTEPFSCRPTLGWRDMPSIFARMIRFRKTIDHSLKNNGQ